MPASSNAANNEAVRLARRAFAESPRDSDLAWLVAYTMINVPGYPRTDGPHTLAFIDSVSARLHDPVQLRIFLLSHQIQTLCVQVLTGYVTEAMRSLAAPWCRSRPIDIGYRGSIQPLSFGRLGFEKRKIGIDVSRALAERDGLRLDITSAPEARLNGTAWIAFLAASKATLGVESGSNLFDFDGSVEQWCREFEVAHPEGDHCCEQFYRRAHDEHLHRFEGNVDYAQVSPRHFEAAAARSVQVLYEGRYSDIFRPGD